jgi:hypothetical protein
VHEQLARAGPVLQQGEKPRGQVVLTCYGHEASQRQLVARSGAGKTGFKTT